MLDIDDLNLPHKILRIAVVTETWPPEVNGVAITMHRLVQEMQQRGHAIQVIRPRQSKDADHLVNSSMEETLTRGLPIPAYPNLKMGLPAKRLMIRIWQRQRPDVVHVATEGPLGWSAVKAAKKLMIPVTSDFRTNFQAYGQHYGLGRFQRAITAYLRKFHNQTDFTTVPTAELKAQLSALGFERLKVLSRGIDTQRLSPSHRSPELRKNWGADPDARVYLYVGRLAPEKNPSLLARAWQVIHERDPRAQLVIVGDGPAGGLYRRLLPQAIHAGTKTGEELLAHYASADIFLFPSTTETYGNVVPEAMASGLMGLTFNYASSHQLVEHDYNGWVARYGDEAHYIDLAKALTALPNDKLLSMRQRARETMTAKGWDVIANQIEALWREQLFSKVSLSEFKAGDPQVSAAK